MRRLALLAGLLGVLAGVTTSADAGPLRPSNPHVFVIVLENKTYEQTFGPTSKAPYLASTLPAQGMLLRQYYGTGHFSLDNYISMVSGQAPNPQTQGDCFFYTDFASPNGGALDGNGQALGNGCVYPPSVLTVADQLQASGRSWKGYMEDMGTPCRRPPLNSIDGTQSARVGDQYAARHNPFVYFHSIIDKPSLCAEHVVDLSSLTTDLQKLDTTPSLSFISPNLCNDGHDAPCVDGKPGGLVSADAFLRTWVPRITSSPAFGKDGILIIAFDESEAGANNDVRSCCNQPTGPNTLMPGITGTGGGRMGAVVLSPFVKPGTVSDEQYNHYSLLRTFEDLYGLPYLGYAGQSGLRSMGTDVFNAMR